MAKKTNSGSGGILLAALGAALLYVLNTGSTAAQIDFKILSAKVLRIALPTSKILLTIAINNPATKDLSFSRFYGNLFLNGVNVATLSYPAPTTIKQLSITDLELPVEISSGDLIANASTYISTGKFPPLIFKGSARINGVTFPIQQTVSLHG